MVPNLAADNLYKFVAIFGLVMILFAVSYPIQLMQEDKVKMSESEKQSATLRVGMERKRETAKQLEAAVRIKSEQLSGEKAVLIQKNTQLDERTKALERQKKIPRSDSPGLAEALARITEDQNTLQSEVTARRTKVDQLSSELKPARIALDDANDELAIRDIELDAQLHLLENETHHYLVAYMCLLLFGFGGIYMCIKGFTLWYYRIQRYQDALLDKYVKEAGLVLSKGKVKRTVSGPEPGN